MHPDVLIHCPFHPERVGHVDTKPSLHISPNGLAYCHGCGWRGTVMAHPELLVLVEAERGVRRAFACKSELPIPPLGGLPKEYLLRRGFSAEVLKLFEVGGNQDRVWIPVKLRDDSLVGVIFRFVVGEDRYRYSYGFHKSLYLFGSKQFVAKDGTVFLVEGALDCMRMHQLGVRNTVALLGDRPSSGQLDLIKTLGDSTVLAFDNDNAGWQSALEVGKLLQRRGHTVSVLSYEGKDPGELESAQTFELIPFLKFLLCTY